MSVSTLQLAARLKAGGVHLAISMLVAAAAAALIFLVWYPPPLAAMQGVDALVMLMVAVDVVLGPLLTTVIYRPGKRSLKFDLAVIAALQLAALGYGLQTIFVGRPALIVFNVDRFDVVSAAAVDPASYRASLADGKPALPWFGPAWRAAFAPTEVEARNALLFSSLQGGADLPQLPQLHRPYDEAREMVRLRLVPLDRLHAANQLSDAGWQALLASCGGLPAERLGYLPLIARARDGVVVVARDDGRIVGIRALKPALR